MTRIVSAVFGPPGSFHRRAARVLVRSVIECSPATPIAVRELVGGDAEIERLGRGASSWRRGNARKARAWADVVATAADGELLVLLDADTFVLRSLADAPAVVGDADLAITRYRPPTRHPINTGVVLVRVGPTTREFFDAWHTATLRMLSDRALYGQWRGQAGGVHQSALAWLRAEGAADGVAIRELDAAEWNCGGWRHETILPETRIVHLLQKLRRLVQGRTSASAGPKTRALAARWKELEKSC